MNAQNDERIDKLIGGTVSDGVPADVHRRLRSQLKDFRHRLGAAESRARHRPATLGRRLSWGAAATIAAVTALAALFGWILRPRVSLADVAATLFQQPWIHGTETGPDGEIFEVWYSPTDDVSAWCRKDWIDYYDHRLKVHYSYDVAEKVLYRTPEYRPRRADRYASIATAFRVLLEDGRSEIGEGRRGRSPLARLSSDGSLPRATRPDRDAHPRRSGDEAAPLLSHGGPL
jgi:hypothetical protein